MKIYKSPKTVKIMGVLKSLKNKLEQEYEQGVDETLSEIINIISDSVEFYDDCLRSWDNPHEKYNNPESIMAGQAACNGGLDMAESIVFKMRKYISRTECQKH